VLKFHPLDLALAQNNHSVTPSVKTLPP